ncbi:MAG: DUF87 domain-containing protein [Acidobacteriota bacterium]
MKDFEKLGVFYLGREFDAAAKQPTDAPVLYDSKDLVTHALCVGMTGSGKTGLGITLIEEAALDGVPAIVIDPKGDLTNLLLTFPELRAADFTPWVTDDDARRAGQPIEAFAAGEAERWRRGLAEWGEDGARIQRLRDAAEFTIYTPGSTAGVPVSVLGSFAPPAGDDPELLGGRVQTTVSSLLALAGIEGDPMKSREHILLSKILQDAWQAGESPDLAVLVQRVQQPAMARIGVIDLDSFFPPAERFAFAMSINALLAAPGFDVWTQGAPLDIAAFLRSTAGKPRVSIFSLPHLDDSQRTFFVALLLNALIGWMRSQSGTSSLRAVLYMDEIFGFFPPVANPPSKLPLLTLLKQARAYGLGIVLATQNPVDLDYKGLSNIGTWWLGRLQTDRDKARVLDGLESANVAGASRAEIDSLLSLLTSRVFLMRNVHEDALTLFQSRWTLSYLRGPLGRDEIRRLNGGKRAAAAETAGASGPAAVAAATAPSDAAPAAPGAVARRPVLPPDIIQYFAPASSSSPAPLRPMLYGRVAVRFVDARLKIDETREVAFAAAIGDGAVPVEWEEAARVELEPDALLPDPPAGVMFQPLPAAAAKARNYPLWGKQFSTWVAANESLELLRAPSIGEGSRAGESERDFRARLQQAARESRDEALERLRKKYAPKQAALDEKLRRAQQIVQREREQATGQKLQTAISVGATLVGALLGRKAFSATTIGRATTAARGVGRAMNDADDVERAQETVAAVGEQRRRLDEELAAETATLDASSTAATERLETIVLKPRKANVTVKLLALVWF